MRTINEPIKPDDHEQYGYLCSALKTHVLIDTQGHLVGYASILSREKAKAMRRLYYAEIIKIMDRLAQEPTRTIRGQDGSLRDKRRFESLREEVTMLFSFVSYMMSSFMRLASCQTKRKHIGLSWYLSMENYPGLIRHELTHATAEILKPIGYPDLRQHGPEFKEIGKVL